MAFIDPLALQLFSLAFISTLLFYSGIIGFVTYSRYGHHKTYQHLRAQAVPLGGIGVAVLSIGLWGELSWPLPGSYNILFYDPYLMLGVVLVSFAASVAFRLRTQYVGLLAAMTGALSIYYGINAYDLGLTKEPLAMLALYVALGGTAVLTFPVTIFMDEKPMTMPWKVAFAGFVLFLLFAVGSAIIALIIGGGALSPHLTSAP
jgi:putative membrane protein